MRIPTNLLLVLALLLPAASHAQKPPAFELKDGDRVAFIGDTFIEREQHYGWIELMLTTQFPDRHVTFRNLGWSADTPGGESRLGLSLTQAGVEPDGEAWKLLQQQIGETKPTVVFLGYGMAASFDGATGLAKFKSDYNRLLDFIEKAFPGARVVLLSPIRQQKVPSTLPDPSHHNDQLKAYAGAVAEIAASRKTRYISLLDVPALNKAAEISDNGIHLNNEGYRRAAIAIESGLGWKSGRWTMAKEAEGLRQLILRKNEFYFHRSRPANMAYIFGFRKGEQGRNSVEMPRFDPLIETEEQKIATLRSLNPANPGSDLQPAPLREGSAAAKFTAQPVPEFQVGDGLEVTLWAENPQLHKPIQINFDARGRLWVASSEVYPQIEPGQAATDKIVILEDTQGTGHADKATVFADGLLIPTGVIPGDGGVYVAQSTELLHFKDTNGDGRADQRRVVLSGFGTEDVHHNLHTLAWGLDGRLWMNQSIYTRTETETPNGVVRLRSGGIMALRTDNLRMDIIFRGWVNAWGHQFDQFGQSFVTDGAGFFGINWGVPGALYETYAKARRTLQSVSPGRYPKFASVEIIYSRQFPADWQGSFITCDFRANRVTRFSVQEQGSGYVTKQEPDLMRTSASTFRPIDVKLGPDGALYIADWSNPIIQHGEVDFRDPRRDKEHGRIWRVAAKDRPVNPQPRLIGAKNSDLLDQLLSPNSFNRSQARRVLLENGGPMLAKDLVAWTKRQSAETALLQALWMQEAINQPDTKLLTQLLNANIPQVRAAAVRVLANWIDRVPNASELLAARVSDSFPRVRLEAVRALAKIPTSKSAGLVLSVLDQPMDPFLDYAVWLSINDLAKPFLAALGSGAWKPEGREKQLEFALKSIEPEMAGAYLSKRLSTQPLARDGLGPWIQLVGQAGGSAELEKMFAQVLNGGFDNAPATRALDALGNAARLRKVNPKGDLGRIGTLFDSPNPPVKLAAVRLAGAWKNIGDNLAKLIAIAGEAKGSPELRNAAFESLREIGGQGVLAGLAPLTKPGVDLAVRRQAVTVLTSLRPDQFAQDAVAVLADTAAESDAQTLWRGLLGAKGAGKALAPAVGKAKLPEAVTRTGLRVAREGGRKEDELVTALTLSSGSTPGEIPITTDMIRGLAMGALSKGDPARGERIYRRPEMSCLSCHAIGGAGGRVGPDMTSIGASAPIDYLAESLLLPNAKIKEGYHSTIIETKDDREFSGILVRETDQEIILRDVSNKEIAVAKSNVANRRNGMSLMPGGLVDALSEQERFDLVRFLGELGKSGPYDAAKGGVARVWKVFGAAHTDLQFGAEKIETGDWSSGKAVPIITLVDGRLLASDIEASSTVGFWQSRVGVYAAASFESAKAGPARFQLDAAGVVQVWLDGKQIKRTGNGGFTPELSAGTHTVVVRMDGQAMPESLRLRSTDVNFLSN